MTNDTTCQHCNRPVSWGQTEQGFAGFTHDDTHLASCVAVGSLIVCRATSEAGTVTSLTPEGAASVSFPDDTNCTLSPSEYRVIVLPLSECDICDAAVGGFEILTTDDEGDSVLDVCATCAARLVTKNEGVLL